MFYFTRRVGRRGTTIGGFTLIELLVVIAIIGILSAVVLASLNTARERGRDARRISDVRQIQLALELYFDDNQGQYPVDIYNATAGLAPTYMARVPTDPLTETNYAYSALLSTCSSYHVGAVMENTGNAVLDNDLDAAAEGAVCGISAADFNGAADNCSGTVAATTDECYDIKP